MITVAESIAVGLLALSISVSENIAVDYSISEAPSDLTITVSETVGTADTSGIITSGLFVSTSENINATDTPGIVTSGPVISSTENIGAADKSAIVTSGLSVSKSEGVGVADTPGVVTAGCTVSASEAVSVAESVAGATSASAALDINASESVGATDTPVVDWEGPCVTLSESITVVLRFEPGVSDSASLAESVAVIISGGLPLSVSEDIGVSDVPIVDAEGPCVTVAESTGVYINTGRSISEAVTVTDTPSVVTSGLEVAVSEAIAGSDGAAEYVGVEEELPSPVVDLSEGISLSDEVGVIVSSLPAIASEDIPVSESVSATVSDLYVSGEDNIAVSDSAGVVRCSLAAVEDSAAVAEEVSVLIGPLSEYVSVSEDVAVSETTSIGNIVLSIPTEGGVYYEGEPLNGSIGGGHIMVVSSAGIIKTDGILYTEGETGSYKGKRYCAAHLNFMLGQDKYTYKLDLGGSDEVDTPDIAQPFKDE
jgi:hypothetical protein